VQKNRTQLPGSRSANKLLSDGAQGIVPAANSIRVSGTTESKVSPIEHSCFDLSTGIDISSDWWVRRAVMCYGCLSGVPEKS
jgi:hypothetical protein